MNKIKLLYDVVMTMKEKEAFIGSLKAEVFKDGAKKFSFENEFEKNCSNGQSKTKISSEVDCDGKKIKHEGTTEFNSAECHEHMHKGFMNRFHNFHKHMHSEQNDKKHCIKEKLTAIAFILNIFNNIKVDEREDKSYLLSLKLNDIPEELKKALHEKLNCKEECCCDSKHFEAMKEFHDMSEHNAELTVFINKSYEVEKAIFAADGKKTGEESTVHEVRANAELCLTW